MPSQTTNHEYDVYEIGDDPPWSHAPLIRALDTQIEIRRPAADRLNYQPKAGAKFFSTDSGAIHIGTGTAWRHVGTVMKPETVVSQDDLAAHTAISDAHHLRPSAGNNLVEDAGAFDVVDEPTFQLVDAVMVEVAERLGPPVYATDGGASSDTLFFNSTDNAVRYKDAEGNVHAPSAGGASDSATYITSADESTILPNSSPHSALTGADLHDPKEHDNAAHSEAFVSDGDATTRQIWVSADGSIPAGAANDDIVLTPAE